MEIDHQSIAVRRGWFLFVVSLSVLSLAADQPPSLTRAQTLLTQGKETAALIELEALLRMEPDNLFALGNAGLICARRGQLSRATQHLYRAHRLKPDDAQLALALLEVYAKLGQKQEAEQLAAEIRNGAKLTSEQIWGAAQLLFRLGSLEAAISLANTDPADSVARHDLLGSIYAAMGDVRKASDEFQEAVRLDPSNDLRYFRLGMLYLKYRTPTLAVVVFNHGVERRPDSPLLWFGLGVSQSLDEKTELAEESMRKAIELNPRFTDAYLLLGDILEQEKPREALEIFRRTIAEHPDLSVAYYYYCRLALILNEGSVEDTIALLRKAVKLDPKFADSHYELGRALEQAGKSDDAIVQFEDCLRLNPRLFRAEYRLSILYKKRGDPVRAAAAAKAFQQAQKLQVADTEMKRLEYEIKQP
jgi:tetratricopeptide (TPR) repeat protein